MDMLKHLPGFRRYWQRKTGLKTSRSFPIIAAELQELGNVFTAQGRADAAAGVATQFSDVYFMIVAADPVEESPLSNLMRLCYEEGTMNLFEMSGCTLVGFVRANNVNGGNPIPLFTPVSPPAEKMDINTLEGWNAAAEKQNRRSFRAVFGRDPANDAELTQWMDTRL